MGRRQGAKMKNVHVDNIRIVHHEANVLSVQSVSAMSPMATIVDDEHGSSSVEMMQQSVDDGVITPNMVTPMIPHDNDQTNAYQIDNDSEEGMLSDNDDLDDDE